MPKFNEGHVSKTNQLYLTFQEFLFDQRGSDIFDSDNNFV
jgi:hypothetical protein